MSDATQVVEGAAKVVETVVESAVGAVAEPVDAAVAAISGEKKTNFPWKIVGGIAVAWIAMGFLLNRSSKRAAQVRAADPVPAEKGPLLADEYFGKAAP